MCGIAGVFHYRSEKIASYGLLEDMNTSLSHRGPDGSGTWISSNGKVGLAHTRLSIIDLQSAASQPMSNQEKSVYVTFNGEIYNHLALRQELLGLGHCFVSDHSDTEVLIHGYLQWGIDGLIQRLKGMFAFALFSVNENAMYLVRDRIGIKPLYFSLQQGALVFASEIKAILKYPGVEKRMAPMAMYHYLSFLATPAPMTMYEGIFKIPAGHYISVSLGGRINAKRYWDALPGKGICPSEINHLSPNAREEFYINGVRQRLEAAVERRMMSDVPYGAFLSGGIDSSANVALMSKFTDKPIKTFTVGFKDHKYLNELDYARKVAKHFKTDHHEIQIDESDMIRYLDDMVYHQDEPLADWVCIPLYYVSKLASDQGVKVVQVGEGADEQFAGYSGYMDFLNLYHRYWQPYRKHVPDLFKKMAASASVQLSSVFSGLGVYADIAHRSAHNREHFWTGATLFWETQKKSLVNLDVLGREEIPEELLTCGLFPKSYLLPDSFEVIRSFRDRLDKAHPESDVLTRMIYNEFKQRLPELLLMRVDKISMSTSLEARVPFLDHDLVQFTMDIGMDVKLKNSNPKNLLKAAVRGLIPDEIIDRPKMGFGAPMKDWLRGDFGRSAKEKLLSSSLVESGLFSHKAISQMFLQHAGGKKDNSGYIWALYNLSLWHETLDN